MMDSSSRPCLRNLTGHWKLDATQSESSDGVLAAMGAGLIARSVLARLDMQLELWQGPSSLLIREMTALGTFSRELVTDGRWHSVAQFGGELAPVRASVCSISGDVSVETSMVHGLLIEHFSLMRRTELGHVRDFFEGVLGAEAAAEAHKHSPSATAVTVWYRHETDAERVAGEEAELAATHAAANSAVSVTLGFTAYPNPSAAESPHPSSPSTAARTVSASAQQPVNEDAPADFTGEWGVDKAASRDTLEAIFSLMGVPWIAAKVALSLDVTTVISHDVATGSVMTEERTSLGVIAKNKLLADGARKPQVGADGRTAHITCAVRAPSPEEFSSGALGALQIVTELPDQLGTTDNTWLLCAEGANMHQTIVFSRGGKTVIAHRVLVNRGTVRVQRQHSELAPADSAMPPLTKSNEISAAPSPSTSTPSPSTPPLPPLPPSFSVSAREAREDDLFFVDITGSWKGSLRSALVNISQRFSVASAAAEADKPLIAGASAALARVVAVPEQADFSVFIRHSPESITFSGGGPLCDAFPRAILLDGVRRDGVLGRNPVGGGGRREEWLGYEAAQGVPAGAPPFYLSGLKCDPGSYALAKIELEKELGSRQKPTSPALWALRVTLDFDALKAKLRVSLSVIDAGGKSVVGADSEPEFNLNAPIEAVRASAKDAAAKARHCRAVIMLRRAEADRVRHAALATETQSVAEDAPAQSKEDCALV
jgi:hypothetical protein